MTNPKKSPDSTDYGMPLSKDGRSYQEMLADTAGLMNTEGLQRDFAEDGRERLQRLFEEYMRKTSHSMAEHMSMANRSLDEIGRYGIKPVMAVRAPHMSRFAMLDLDGTLVRAPEVSQDKSTDVDVPITEPPAVIEPQVGDLCISIRGFETDFAGKTDPSKATVDFGSDLNHCEIGESEKPESEDETI